MQNDTSLCWGTADSHFRLSADSEDLCLAARSVLSPWLKSAARSIDSQCEDKRTKPGQSWHLGLAASGAHTVAGPDGLTIEASLNDAVTTIEYAAATHQFYDGPPGKAVHAALLSTKPQGGVLLVGPSHSGKSTLACALWQRGWQLHADDAAILDPSRRTAWPICRRVSVRRTSRSLLGEELWESLKISPSCTPSAEGMLCHPKAQNDKGGDLSKNQSVSICAIFFLRRRLRQTGERPSEDQGLARIDPAGALLAFVPYTNARPDQTGEAIGATAPLFQDIPAYDLDIQEPHTMAKIVEREITALR